MTDERLTYSEDDVEAAPFGHVRFVGTDVDVVAYPIGARDLCVLVNKTGVCVYRVTLANALRGDLVPIPDLLSRSRDTFVVHDLADVLGPVETTE